MVTLLQETCVTNTPLSGVHTGFELWEGGGKFSQCSSYVSCSIVLYIHVLLKLIKTCLHSQLSDSNLEHLMKVAIEGPPLKDVDFNAIMDIFKIKNRSIEL